MTQPVRQHRSVSQINSYKKCAYSYKLARIDKAWSRPAAWLAQGSAVHEVAEQWEQSDRTMSLEEAQELFDASYEKHIAESCDTTPNFDYWFASGPYKGEADVERRYLIGLEQVEKLINWHLANPDQVIWAAPDGTRGIELGFDIDLDGVLVRGFIDAVRVVDAEIQVVDYKTGLSPGDDFQLGVYAVALADMYDIEPPRSGVYFMTGKKGKKAGPTVPYDLTEWTRERVTAEFHHLERNIQAGNFEPDPEPSKCRFCSYSYSCQFAMG